MTQVSMARRIAALQKLPVPELVVEYERLHGVPPHCKNRTWLWRNCAWKVQEIAYGGLPAAAKARLEELIAQVAVPDSRTVTTTLPRRSSMGQLAPGTTLTKTWRGQQVTVRVADDGTFVHDGKPYRSLTAVAQAITGQHWSGALFFGLRKRSKKLA